MVEKEVAALIALIRRHRRAFGAAVRRAVDDEAPGAVEEEAGPFVFFYASQNTTPNIFGPILNPGPVRPYRYFLMILGPFPI